MSLFTKIIIRENKNILQTQRFDIEIYEVFSIANPRKKGQTQSSDEVIEKKLKVSILEAN